MNYDKQPINVDEQVALLQNRGLVIEDIATAKLQLRNISYFRIASYLRYMEEDRQFHHYKLGSTQSSQKASGKRVWTTSIHLLGKLDKVYNRASQLLCSPCPYME